MIYFALDQTHSKNKTTGASTFLVPTLRSDVTNITPLRPQSEQLWTHNKYEPLHVINIFYLDKSLNI